MHVSLVFLLYEELVGEVVLVFLYKLTSKLVPGLSVGAVAFTVKEALK